MTSLELLARALEEYALPNREGDAMDLATLIDALIKERIAEALSGAQRRSGDS